MISAKISAVPGVSSALFNTTPLPQMSAGNVFQHRLAIGVLAGDDEAGNAAGLPHRHGVFAAGAGCRRPAIEALPLAGIEARQGNATAGFALRLAERLAGLDRDHSGDLVGTRFERIGNAMENRPALHGGNLRPNPAAPPSPHAPRCRYLLRLTAAPATGAGRHAASASRNIRPNRPAPPVRRSSSQLRRALRVHIRHHAVKPPSTTRLDPVI